MTTKLPSLTALIESVDLRFDEKFMNHKNPLSSSQQFSTEVSGKLPAEFLKFLHQVILETVEVVGNEVIGKGLPEYMAGELCHKCIIERTIPQPNTDQECKSIYCVCPKALMSGGICYSCNKEVYRSPQPNTGDVTEELLKDIMCYDYLDLPESQIQWLEDKFKARIDKLLANQRQEIVKEIKKEIGEIWKNAKGYPNANSIGDYLDSLSEKEEK